jgi:hypothetical protein
MRSSWRKLLTISVPAIIIGGLLVAAMTEAWVRATWDARRGMPGFFLSDATLGQRLAPGYDGWFAGVPVHINSLGLRDPREYPLDKGPRTFRILVLGDSVTFGHGSVYEHTYPRLVEESLKAWRRDIDWQVWNAAVPGYNTSQELAQLLRVGPRFRPDLVVVGFFENDLVDYRELAPPGRAAVALANAVSIARRHLYSFELYKRIALTAAWRLSASNEYRLRLENLGPEEELLSRASDASRLPQQALTPYDRVSDAEADLPCQSGAGPSDMAAVAGMVSREPGYGAWRDAVNGFGRLNAAGQYRVVFYLNQIPLRCPSRDTFYDGGTRAENAFYMDVFSQAGPTVSCYDAFLHTRPSQMPNADEHAIGNANAVKADVLFTFLRDRVLPGALPARLRAAPASAAPPQ